MTVIGVGTQDSAEEALEFVERYGTYSFPMLWDETFVTWSVFGVRSQPAAALITGDGEPISGWLGPFPEDQVLELAASATS